MARAICLALVLAGCASSEWTKDYDGPVPGAHPDSTFATIVVDAASGAPLPRAHLRLYRDNTEPVGIPGELVHEARADEYGVVSFPWRDEYAGCHFVFEAIGFAPHCDLGAPKGRVELRPGLTWRGQLLGPQGGPAAGVTIEYYTGCPHSPALRTVTTDANGRFVLPDIGAHDGYLDGFLWAVAPGAIARPFTPGTVTLGLLEPILPEPGVTVTGTVYDAADNPAKGAVVYSTQTERGPKVVTSSDGTFTLHGVDPTAEVLFTPPGARADMERTPLVELPPPPAPPPSSTVRVRPPGDVHEYLYFAIGQEGQVDPDENGRVELHTSLRGPVRISFRHERHGDGEVVVNVDDTEVEVPPAAFTVPGFLAAPDDVDVSVFDAEGGWGDAEGPTSWRYRDGTWLRLLRSGHATNYRRLSGSGPYAVRVGSATLEIRTGATDTVFWVDGERFGSGTIRGLDAGPHTVLVGAPGRRGKALLVILGEGETRPVDLPLKPK